MYKLVIKPLLFCFDPETVHSMLVRCLKVYRYLYPVRLCIRKYYSILMPCSYPEGKLNLKNRIGLSAGFDKNADIFNELADFGFGFVEIGTVTPDAQPGNPPKRIFRLVKDESLISRTGFNNIGVDAVLENIKKNRKHYYILGANINKNPSSTGEKAVDDFIKIFLKLYDYVDYFTINWGSISAEEFTQVVELMTTIRDERKKKRSIFIKLPADIKMETVSEVLKLAEKHYIDGFIASGPTMDRSLLKYTSVEELGNIGTGGVSGKGIGNKSVDLVNFLSSYSGRSFLIIGAGGIMSKKDIEAMYDAGADLVQIYSGFIYSGPGIVKKLARISPY